MGIRLCEIAKILGAEIQGDGSLEIHGASGLGEARKGDIAFLEKKEMLVEAGKSLASALIVPLDFEECPKPFVRTENPRLGFAKVLELFEQPPSLSPGVHPTAVLGEGVTLGKAVSIGAYCVIGDDCRIGSNVKVFPHCCLGRNCKLGEGAVLFPRVTLYDGVVLGKNCRVDSGAVIGGDGFGYVQDNGRNHRMPQIGTVIIGDEVDIGANTTIDRSTTGATKIGSGTKIDNLVQIAHNVSIGENCCICGQVGISGSVKIGDRVILAGQAGLKDHISIGSGAIVGAQAGVISDVPPGAFYSGYPARPHWEQMKIHAVQQRLPQLIKELKRLKSHLLGEK